MFERLCLFERVSVRFRVLWAWKPRGFGRGFLGRGAAFCWRVGIVVPFGECRWAGVWWAANGHLRLAKRNRILFKITENRIAPGGPFLVPGSVPGGGL